MVMYQDQFFMSPKIKVFKRSVYDLSMFASFFGGLSLSIVNSISLMMWPISEFSFIISAAAKMFFVKTKH